SARPSPSNSSRWPAPSSAKAEFHSAGDGASARRPPISRDKAAADASASVMARRLGADRPILGFALPWVPATGGDVGRAARREGLEAQARAQRLEREHVPRIDVAQADVGAEAPDEGGLLSFLRRLPDQAIAGRADPPLHLVQEVAADRALYVVDADALAGLAPLDDDP